jgi:hypothetical protein
LVGEEEQRNLSYEWRPPEAKALKLNTDESFKMTNKKGGWGFTQK